MRKLVIAIDGPSGAGKGTVARSDCARSSATATSTAARCIARSAGRRFATACRSTTRPPSRRSRSARASRSSSAGVTIDGADVTRAIRTPEIDRAAAAVARLPRVRAVLVERQRALGAGGGIVMEGRDIGTVVFPDADVKVYLDASPEERARRRAQRSGAYRVPAAVSDVATLLTERDELDRTRERLAAVRRRRTPWSSIRREDRWTRWSRR